MLRNYLAAAIRSLFRDRAYAAINILGLAIGLTAVLLIALYVKDEYSFDRQFPQSDRTYRMHVEYVPPGRAPVRISVTSANVARALELYFPEVEVATRLVPGGGTLRQGDIQVQPQFLHWADPNFFQVFPMKAVAGDPDATIRRPDGLVLSRRMARQLFNREDVVGETVTLRFSSDETLHVGAVIEDLPHNTHFNVDAVAAGVASFSMLTRYDQMASRPDMIQPENVYTYVRLRPGGNVDKLNASMEAFVARHLRVGRRDGVELSRSYRLSLVSLPAIHFLPRSIAEMKPPSDPRTAQGMVLIGVLILVVAASNFVSMMTARSARRAIEVGVRKAVGATRKQIIVQFMGECLFYSGLALGVALIAVELLLPAFNGFLQRDIALDLVGDWPFGAAVVAGWLIVGLAAGAYPALVLSMFRPVTVLKGTVSLPGGPGRLRQAIVVLQFATLIGLIIATLTVQRQTRFAMEDQLRVPGDEVFILPFGCIVDSTLRDVLVKISGVRGASCVSGSSLARDRFGTAFRQPNGTTVDFRAAAIDESYFEMFGIAPLAGRLLDRKHGEDDLVVRERGTTLNPSIVINESGARALGFSNPQDALNQYRRWTRPTSTAPGDYKVLPAESSQIVGVVPDFTVGSVRDAIEPTAYYIDPSMVWMLVVKLDGARIPETMPAIEAAWKQATDGRPFGGQFLSQVLDNLYADIQRQTKLFGAFSGVAIVVASLGLLGLAVFTAERRTREIGVRKAMGASRIDILRFIGWQFARPVVLANLVAWPVAWFFMQRWLEGFAYHVELGPLVFLAASGLALAIALATVSGHALMVARARPVEALRYE